MQATHADEINRIITSSRFFNRQSTIDNPQSLRQHAGLTARSSPAKLAHLPPNVRRSPGSGGQGRAGIVGNHALEHRFLSKNGAAEQGKEDWKDGFHKK
jgi:hypothetical protein